MLRTKGRVLCIVGLLVAVFVATTSWSVASSVIPCAYPGTQEEGGCQGCWVAVWGIRWSPDIGWTDTYLQASCADTNGDETYINTNWLTVPSPAVSEDTVACEGGIRFYLTDNEEPAIGPICGYLVGSEVNAAKSACSDVVWGTTIGPTTCNKTRRTETEIPGGINVNCAP